MKVDVAYNSNYFWRIIFTLMVTVIHTNWLGHHTGWYLAVEYFFIMSGFFLMRHWENTKQSSFSYMFGRVVKLWPHQLFSFILLFIWTYRELIRSGSGVLHKLVLHLGEALPFTYFFSNYESTGVSFINFPVWYISVLLLVSMLFYYLLSRHKDFFCNLFLPLVIILVYRYLYHNCDSINVAEYEGILINGFYLRGLGAMACGCLIYCLVQKLSRYTYSRKFFACMRILEFISMVGMIGLSYYYGDSRNDVFLVLLLCMGTICSFLYPAKTILSCNIVKKASNYMYPVYLNHLLVLAIMNAYITYLPQSRIVRYLLFLVIVIPYSVITKWIVDFCVKKIAQLLRSFTVKQEKADDCRTAK